jgi:uncharacterized protein YbjQ (UPF0145 family)
MALLITTKAASNVCESLGREFFPLYQIVVAQLCLCRGKMRSKREERAMIVTTTPSIEGRVIVHYLGIVAGEAVIGANVFRDLFAGIRDVIGGRSGAYEKTLREARQTAIDELILEANALGADAIVGVSVDFEGGVHQGTMMMVAASGTAVKLR